jgi:hypothetical protein
MSKKEDHITVRAYTSDLSRNAVITLPVNQARGRCIYVEQAEGGTFCKAVRSGDRRCDLTKFGCRMGRPIIQDLAPDGATSPTPEHGRLPPTGYKRHL